MIFAINFSDLPADAIGLVVILLLSLLSVLKDKLFQRSREPDESEFTEEEREIIWRRQVETLPPPLHRATPPQIVIHSVVKPTPPLAPPQLPKVVAPSDRELELARAFEVRGSRKGRTGHRREIDRLLRSPYAARNAVLLTEILGPPVALKADASDHLPR
ncbi:hypothetical protein HNR46_003138 [Haloferula luteola]|uniref:Uncharacterized protein n=1 Tax=Haloferula luteola TaxID=595692 RepID=A0A840VGE2_9BACT|nr:hypothetical protein [Haloferula luteola]MBB5352889.1 hypothetical protein [Haloferula luteola]